jgi:hypothetical protein
LAIVMTASVFTVAGLATTATVAAATKPAPTLVRPGNWWSALNQFLLRGPNGLSALTHFLQIDWEWLGI